MTPAHEEGPGSFRSRDLLPGFPYTRKAPGRSHLIEGFRPLAPIGSRARTRRIPDRPVARKRIS
jgi:hypothetical protein